MRPDEKVKYCIQCGTSLDHMLIAGEQRPACPNCGWVYFSDPKVAAGVLVESEGNILLVRRKNEPCRGMWSFPAGFVNAYEDPVRAAERECLEETGFVVRVTQLVDVIAGREHEKGADMVIVYRAILVSGALTAGDDADQAKFFPREALPPLAFLATRKVLGV